MIVVEEIRRMRRGASRASAGTSSLRIPGFPTLAAAALGAALAAAATVEAPRAAVSPASTPGGAATAPAQTAPAACKSQTFPFLERNRGAYERALRSGQRWLDALRVDPIELRAAGIKGKKKLVELLDTYVRLWEISGPKEKAALLERVRGAVAVTGDPRYHDMRTVDDTTFKQDATSYLRAAFLMDRIGLDTSRYRKEIAAIKPRLDGQMAQRGIHQRLAFQTYYRHFGLAEPFPLGNAAREGLIATRRDPATLAWDEVYGLTHEVFVPYEFGDRLDANPFGPGDKEYLRKAIDLLIPQYIARKNPDIVAELVSSARMLRFVEDPAYREGIEFLLVSQNPDGCWGSEEWAKGRYGAHAAAGSLLHTTGVTLDALTLVFHEPWNRALYPGCVPLSAPAAPPR
jgi:uncharacterized protein DUF6895